MLEGKAKARIILCAYAGWSESAHWACLKPFFAWRAQFYLQAFTVTLYNVHQKLRYSNSICKATKLVIMLPQITSTSCEMYLGYVYSYCSDFFVPFLVLCSYCFYYSNSADSVPVLDCFFAALVVSVFSDFSLSSWPPFSDLLAFFA